MNPGSAAPENQWDTIILGGGAAGMATAIFLLEQLQKPGHHRPRLLIIEGARKPGAKILVSGGGRCNVTHKAVTPEDYQGGNRTIIRNVLRAFPVESTLAWMQSMGVQLKLEETGKWFPTSDKARTVLDGLLQRLEDLGAAWLCGVRAQEIRPANGQWSIACSNGTTHTARTIVMATGGMALPKSGSDGWGLEVMKHFGHRMITPRPALAPIVLDHNHPSAEGLSELSGLTTDLRVTATSPSGQQGLFSGSTLITHFGLSGPAPMNISRFLTAESPGHPANKKPTLTLAIPAMENPTQADQWLLQRTAQSGTKSVAALLQEHLPERLARWFAGPNAERRLTTLTRSERLTLRDRISQFSIPVTGTRGFSFAETTAGGVALEEIDHRTMQSRIHPGLYLVGEILDVDGRIGGFNFQWAWASARVAARAIAKQIS